MDKNNITNWYYDFIECGFSFYPSFFSELFSLVQKFGRGNEKEIFNLINKQFRAIDSLRENINKFNGNEILKYTDSIVPFYSIHIKNRTVNIRICLVFNAHNDPCLLYAFNEKSDSNDTYRKHLPEIKKRFEEFVDLT